MEADKKFCVKCGSKVGVSDNFCENCGNKLSQSINATTQETHLDGEASSSNEEFVAALSNMLKKHKDTFLYVISDGELSEDKIENARKYIGVPESEKIIALINNTFMHSFKLGIAICESGICWKMKKNDERNCLLWSELASNLMHLKKSSILSTKGITLTPNHQIDTDLYPLKKLFDLIKDSIDIFLKHPNLIENTALKLHKEEPLKQSNIGKHPIISLVIFFIVFSFIVSFFDSEPNKSTQQTKPNSSTLGVWIDDVGSPSFLNATFTIYSSNGEYYLKRHNADGSHGTYKLKKEGSKYIKLGDVNGAHYIISQDGNLRLNDKRGYIRTAKKR